MYTARCSGKHALLVDVGGNVCLNARVIERERERPVAEEEGSRYLTAYDFCMFRAAAQEQLEKRHDGL